MIMIISCAGQKTEVDLPLEFPDSFSVTGSTVIPDMWWTAFNDHQLNAFIDSALTSNFTIETAWHRFAVSQAISDRERSSLIPGIEAFFQSEFNNQSGTNEPQYYRLGLSSSYEIDLWGRMRSGVKAEQFRAEASLFDYHTAVITISAEIAFTWYRIIEALNQIDLINDQIELNNQVLDLMLIRFESGQIKGVDVLRQKELLESTREEKLKAETRLRLLNNQMSVLIGHLPAGEREHVFSDLPELSPLPESGIPSQILQRRPDVKSAYYLLLAADKDLATAINSRYPRFSLRASVSSPSGNFENLFTNWAYTVAGNLVAPLFYGGRLKAEVRRTKALTNQLFSNYAQTILIAYREVEDALIQEEKQKEIIGSIQEQLTIATQVYKQLEIEYLNGAVNYLDILTALAQEQQLRRDLISARLVLIDYRISLYRALAGGFETERESQI